MITNQADGPGLRERDTVLPIVPMFHANAWGLAYAGTMAGSKLVLPGPKMDPASLARLIADERVTIAGAVPTIWQGIAQIDPQARPVLTAADHVRWLRRSGEPDSHCTTSASASRSSRRGA